MPAVRSLQTVTRNMGNEGLNNEGSGNEGILKACSEVRRHVDG